MEMTTSDMQQVRAMVAQWSDLIERKGWPIGDMPTNNLVQLAKIAMDVTSTTPKQCGAAHLVKTSVVCTDRAGHEPEHTHYNHDAGVSWDDRTGMTMHTTLGLITLEPDPEPEPVAIPGAQDMLDALQAAGEALVMVQDKYYSDSKAITARIVRKAQTARELCALAEAGLLAGVEAVRTGAQAS